MWVKDAEQSLCDLGQLVVQLAVNAARQKSKSLNETLDVRFLTFVLFKEEPARDFRVSLREFRPQLAQEGQLALVVSQKVVSHHSPSA